MSPARIFLFEQLCAYPHGSGNTKALSDYLAAFAKERGLEHYQDDLNNVIIIKEASAGYEQAPAVILQGHMDMVCEKAPDCTKNMALEGLDLAVEGDTVFAKGTTLGGDDGIAVAMALAVLDDDSIAHPRVEAVFTVDEETGMYGAAGLDVSPLRGRMMLNMDSEAEGIFTVSCAGGNVTRCTLPIARAPFAGGALLTISVGGLQGGHSGVEVDKGRGNANMLLGRVLLAVQKATVLRLVSVSGGLKDNAIPVSAAAVVAVADADAAKAACARMEACFRTELRITDPAVAILRFGRRPGPSHGRRLHRQGVVHALLPAQRHPGHERRHPRPGADLSEPGRPHHAGRRRHRLLLHPQQCGIPEGDAGRSAGVHDAPAGRLPDGGRRLSRLGISPGLPPAGADGAGLYRAVRPRPQIEAIHAGVECGLLAGKLPGLDCVSFGPDLTEIHTFREKMHISSVQRTWALLLEVLKRIK